MRKKRKKKTKRNISKKRIRKTKRNISKKRINKTRKSNNKKVQKGGSTSDYSQYYSSSSSDMVRRWQQAAAARSSDRTVAAAALDSYEETKIPQGEDGTPYIMCEPEKNENKDGYEPGDLKYVDGIPENVMCVYEPYEDSKCCDEGGEPTPIRKLNAENPIFTFQEIYPSGAPCMIDDYYEFVYAIKTKEPETLYYQLANYGIEKYTGLQIYDCKTKKKRNMFQHPCLVGEGDHVITAGVLRVYPDKKEILFNNSSGHYKPGPPGESPPYAESLLKEILNPVSRPSSNPWKVIPWPSMKDRAALLAEEKLQERAQQFMHENIPKSKKSRAEYGSNDPLSRA